MQNGNRDSEPSMSDRLRWLDNTDEIINLSRSIWSTRYGSLDDNDRHVREVDQQSDKPHLASQSDFTHRCTRHPERNCNCPSGACADDDATYRYARGPYTSADTSSPKLASYRCAISGQFCSGSSCREWCESGVDRSKT